MKFILALVMRRIFILFHTNVTTRDALASQLDRFAAASLFRCRLVSSAQPHVVSIALSRESHQNQQKPVSADPARALNTRLFALHLSNSLRTT